jgi:phosphodiesterase/alkaline phosphatase D-like protein
VAEEWLIKRINNSPAKHYAMVPSHPFGWTAGKWREWYPDVVAPEGYTGVVANELLSDVQGQLTTAAQKYFWQKGWWDQHQRLLGALANSRQESRIIFSGDIHAQGAVNITSSGELVLEKPVKSFLVGPVSTSDATWPSSARGISAKNPGWLTSDELLATREVNGFTIFEFEGSAARARLFDCGGYDRSKGEDGRVQRVDEIVIQE